MKTATAFIAALCLISSVAFADDAKLTFPAAGFSIAPLAAPQKEAYQVVMMFRPATNGFAPNVNVQIQPYADGVDAYAKLSKGQFAQIGLTLISENKPDASTVVWEYSGAMQGTQLHWYAKAVQKDGFIYLTTATSLETQWAAESAALKACVDSFEMAKAGAAGGANPLAR